MARLSQEQIDTIPILYEQLKTHKAVAAELGVSTATIAKYLKLAGVQTVKNRITPEQKIQINEVFAIEKCVSKTAEIVGVSTTSVKNYLNEENLKILNKKNEDFEALWYYIIRLFGIYDEAEQIPVDPWNIVQTDKFVKQGISYRAQLLTLKYFYEIKKNKVQEQHKTIGLIPYIYSEAAAYYLKEEQKQQQMLLEIQKQLEKDRVEIKYKPSHNKNKRKKKIDLNSLESEA